MRARLTLATLVVLASTTLFGAARVRAPIGWSDLDRWLARTSPEAATLAVARLALLGCAAWLLVVTVLAVAAGCVGARPGGRALHRIAAGVAPAVLRVLVASALTPGAASALTPGAATALTPGAATALSPGAATALSPRAATALSPRAATALTPGVATTGVAVAVRTGLTPLGAHDPVPPLGTPTAVPPLAPVRSGRTTAPGTPATVPAPPSAPTPPTPPTAPTAPAARPSAPPVTAPVTAPVAAPTTTPIPAPVAPPVPAVVDPSGTHRVAPGEHLWGIAAAVVRARTGGDDLVVIDRYWRALCAANADRIASGDVDRIHPGEDLLLPPGP
ncbi:MAG: hypothetical protein FJW77_09150 [Actinobacteria bacterium]|nr:hypothetical protein [Actinomycetota bacterium]